LSKGKGDKGSKFLFCKYVNHNQDDLNKLILMSSPSLLSFIDREQTFIWKSPLKDDNCKEYRNEFLELVDEWKGKREHLENYWPKIGPQWDGLAVVQGKDGQKGLLICEAKAHVKEMKSRIKAEDHSSIELINRTIDDVKNRINSKAQAEIWLNHYYQLANRLSFLYLLNKKLEIPTWLVLVNFINDPTHIPTSLSEWLSHYQTVFSEMDINYSADLFKNVIMIYPDGDLNKKVLC
jgi:hypothetical protein